MTKSILVVDDETSINFALEHLMKSEGYKVATAHDGNEAIDCVCQTHPDLILLDVSLPHKDGYEICQALRADTTTQNIKIIMMSARSRDIEIEKGLAMGANAYLTKPFSLGKVTQTVRDILAQA
ncbi:response regulator transcription factor [Cohaesibacter gelatinilyticus]|uniref:Response regulator receiver domain-containing protein n=1 Tax=Cohaesibacter gelatinilyticus TaxID=372072 RepID=A0A285PH08_9HYPH|nr:response regulator [Cohaesibacter gelatinilyticus]SNZ21009.1 Response regulator receiver domain-containing protein [Cohaesibacter gelatinilyticus]HAT86243.1 response regulator [Hyphomicrobiales bacterium]